MIMQLIIIIIIIIIIRRRRRRRRSHNSLAWDMQIHTNRELSANKPQLI